MNFITVCPDATSGTGSSATGPSYPLVLNFHTAAPLLHQIDFCALAINEDTIEEVARSGPIPQRQPDGWKVWL